MPEENIIKINIEEEMKSAYIDYSMSVIVSRALPDVRDGLKPVHRRVLYGMYDMGVLSNRPYKKSARIVGDVLGKFHPHGDSSVYDALVRMAQEWSLRYPLIDGQGNFGSIDGDSPAAMRYTEVRLRKIAEEALADIDKDTVDFQLNFDDTLKEPTVLPTRIPLLMVNGAAGIAVGMATNIPPHNLTEVINALVAQIDNPEITTDELMEHIKGPDFPTGGTIYGYQGIKDAFETGRGRIVVRAKTEIETKPSGREQIIVREIPYMVNKAELIKKIGDLVNEKKIEGVVYVNDESDRDGMRIVITLKKDASANVVLNKLYKYTQLQSSFNVNSIALVKGRPRLLNLKQLLHYFIEHRHDVVVRRTQYELAQAEKRAHILEGLIIALDHLDEVIKLIRASKTVEEAREGLMNTFDLSEVQARAILDMRLQKLTGLEREKLHEEYDELMKQIKYMKEVLASVDLQMEIVKKELLEVKEKYGDERRTDIVPDEGEFNPEDFYTDEEVVITISHLGYIKRTALTEFRRQSRGGIGSRGSITREEDFIEHLYVATMHNTMLFFTEKGRCYWLKVWQIPEGTRTAKGRAIQNLVFLEPGDSVKAYINVKSLKDEEYINSHYIMLATKKGVIKKTSLEAFSRPRQKGINAVTIREGDQLLTASLTNGHQQILLAVRSGRALRFPEEKVRAMGRTAAGVRGITLRGEEDEVVDMVCVESKEQTILVVSEKGYGKRSSVEDYRITNRGGKGVKTINITEKTGALIAMKGVTDAGDLMIINRSGVIIRMPVSDIRVMGRATQGVRLINIREGDSIAAVTYVETQDADEEHTENNEDNTSDSPDTPDNT
jgi:DNA gyrase subunit A